MNGAWQAIIASAVGIAFTALARIVDRLLPDPQNKNPMPPAPGLAPGMQTLSPQVAPPAEPPGMMPPPPQPPNAAGH